MVRRMRDIRTDIVERLEAVRKERAQAEVHVAALQQREAVLQAMLQQEDERLAETSIGASNVTAARSNGRRYASPLALFVLSALRSHGPCELRQLKQAAVKEGFPFGKKNPGRVLHFLLVGMAQNNLVERHRDGTWHLTGKDG